MYFFLEMIDELKNLCNETVWNGNTNQNVSLKVFLTLNLRISKKNYMENKVIILSSGQRNLILKRALKHTVFIFCDALSVGVFFKLNLDFCLRLLRKKAYEVNNSMKDKFFGLFQMC